MKNTKANNQAIALATRSLTALVHLLLLMSISSMLQAAPTTHSETWLFSLGSHQVTKHAHYRNNGLNTQGMDNIALAHSAAAIRDNSLNSVQRIMNYQWLRNSHDKRVIRHNSVGARELVRRSFRYYWQHNHTPASSHNAGQHDSSFNYNVRLSPKKFRLSINYSF